MAATPRDRRDYRVPLALGYLSEYSNPARGNSSTMGLLRPSMSSPRGSNKEESITSAQ